MADEARVQLIDSFKEVCGVDDDVVARDFLERCEWDLEMAIQEYLNEKEGQPSVMSRERLDNIANNRRQEQMQAAAAVQNPAPNAQNQPQSWFQWAFSVLTLPVRFVTTSIWDLLSFIYQLFFSPFRRAITDPVAEVAQFVNDFNTKYGSAHPNFYQGTYSMALQDAKRELKYLLVYLHSDLHQNTERFCRETLCDRRLLDFITSKDMLVWGSSVRSSEGYRVSLAMRETTYPFLALICQRDNRMVVVVRQEGICTTDELLQVLNLAVNDNDIYLRLARQERQHQQQNQILRQQQEAAFQESLRADREKERRRQEEERQKQEQAREAERLEQERLDKRRQWEQRREEIRRNLPPEPETGDIVRVMLKFPTGTRLERRFLMTDSLEFLYNVAISHEECPMNFSIQNVYPRKTLRCIRGQDDEDQTPVATFEQSGLRGAITLLVQDNEA